MTNTVIAQICFTADDQDVLINVTNFVNKKGSYSLDAASDGDYYGYSDCDWFVTDENDKEISLGSNHRADIIARIFDHFAELEEELEALYDERDTDY
jgi:hypothetical protein